MNTQGREVIGTCKQDMLIADTSMPVDVATVNLAATEEETLLLKGSVLAEADTDGTCKLLSGAKGEQAAYILKEDVETSTTGKVVAEVYRTGKFVRNALIVADDYELSVADERALRNAGIYLENAME